MQASDKLKSDASNTANALGDKANDLQRGIADEVRKEVSERAEASAARSGGPGYDLPAAPGPARLTAVSCDVMVMDMEPSGKAGSEWRRPGPQLPACIACHDLAWLSDAAGGTQLRRARSDLPGWAMCVAEGVYLLAAYCTNLTECGCCMQCMPRVRAAVSGGGDGRGLLRVARAMVRACVWTPA